MTMRQASVLVQLIAERRQQRLRDMIVAARSAHMGDDAFKQMMEKLEQKDE